MTRSQPRNKSRSPVMSWRLNSCTSSLHPNRDISASYRAIQGAEYKGGHHYTDGSLCGIRSSAFFPVWLCSHHKGMAKVFRCQKRLQVFRLILFDDSENRGETICAGQWHSASRSKSWPHMLQGRRMRYKPEHSLEQIYCYWHSVLFLRVNEVYHAINSLQHCP
jgi:hypothetical protein